MALRRCADGQCFTSVKYSCMRYESLWEEEEEVAGEDEEDPCALQTEAPLVLTGRGCVTHRGH